MPLGFFGGTAICSVLEANRVGSPATSLSLVALSMFLVSAEAKMSAGAPCCNWVTRSDDPAKLKVTLTPGWAVSNCLPSSVKVFFSEAAANTVSVPDSDFEEALLDPAFEPDVLDAPSSDDDPQPPSTATIPVDAPIEIATARTRFTILLQGFRR